ERNFAAPANLARLIAAGSPLHRRALPLGQTKMIPHQLQRARHCIALAQQQRKILDGSPQILHPLQTKQPMILRMRPAMSSRIWHVMNPINVPMILGACRSGSGVQMSEEMLKPPITPTGEATAILPARDNRGK